MIQIVAAAMSLVLGAVVVAFGQERRVNPWIGLLSLSCAVLTIGHLVETANLELTFPAARVIMIAAVFMALAGSMSAQIMCGIRPSRPIWILAAAAAAINVVTVLLTDWYFTGGVTRYSWGHFVTGKPEFLVNPLSVSAIAMYGLGSMVLHYRKAHPLDRNRIGFFIVAYGFLSLTLLDYLPHFGIDLFGGLASVVAVPLFMASFGYASLRYRLLEFKVFLGRAAGYLLVLAVMVGAYAVWSEIGRRLGLDAERSGPGGAILLVVLFASLGRALPRLLERAARRGESDYNKSLEAFSTELVRVWDEKLLAAKVRAICTADFLCSSAVLIGEAALRSDELLPRLAFKAQVIETEILRRRFGYAGEAARGYDLIVPLLHGDRLMGALGLGQRSDGRIYSLPALQGFRTLGNIVSMAMANARAALELQKRQSLDRYLAPQVVETVLGGGADIIEKRQRITITVFFSDLTHPATIQSTQLVISACNDRLESRAKAVV